MRAASTSLQKFAYAIRRLFVVPAKAGIQGERHERALDPRFRGGDDTFGNLRKVVLAFLQRTPASIEALYHLQTIWPRLISLVATSRQLLHHTRRLDQDPPPVRSRQ
jgi:hypothetical protein